MGPEKKSKNSMNKNKKMCKIHRAVLCNKKPTLVVNVIMTCVEKVILVSFESPKLHLIRIKRGKGKNRHFLRKCGNSITQIFDFEI